MITVIMIILAGISTLMAILCYFAPKEKDTELLAHYLESVCFLLFAILLVLVAVLFKLL